MTLPLRVGILTGGRAPGVEALLDQPALFEIVAVMSAAPALSEAAVLEAKKIPLIQRPLEAWCREQHVSPRNLAERRGYDSETADLLAPFSVDVLLLYGYPYLISEPLLDAYPGRIVGIHDGDLMPYPGPLRGRYAGPHAVRDAILAGEQATRSSLYYVTEGAGDGPVALVSEALPVALLVADCIARGDWDSVSDYVRLHRSWMRRTAWGPLMRRFLEHLAAGGVQRVGDQVWIDGVPAPCRLGESPTACHHDPPRLDIPHSCPFIALR